MYDPATLADYWSALYTRKWIIFAVAASTMLFTIVISRMLPPVYESKSSFFVPNNLLATSFTTALQRPVQTPLKPLPDEKEAGIHVGVLRSPDIAERVNARFPEVHPNFFKKNVDFVTSPQFFTEIYVRDRRPQLAADIANAYIDVYEEFHRDLLRERARKTEQVLKGQVKILHERISDRTSEISAFQQEHDIVSSEASEQRYSSQALDLERQRDDIEVEIRAMMGERLRKQGALAADGPEDPSMRGPRSETLKKLQEKATALNARIRQLRDENKETIGRVVEFQTMESERDNLRQLLDSVERSLAETQLEIEQPNVAIIRVQTAKPPRTPGFPIITLNALAALIIGLAAGCYNALLLEYFRRLRIERTRRNLDESLLQEIGL